MRLVYSNSHHTGEKPKTGSRIVILNISEDHGLIRRLGDQEDVRFYGGQTVY